MNMYEIIRKKRDGGSLSREEIAFWLQGYVAGELPDYQSAALLMACFIQGLNREETVSLTRAMVDSGKVLTLDSLPGLKVDKHSTGGVGDKTTLIVIPILAAAGLYVPKMSGRGLGHTGGTLDKLESIPGFKTGLSLEEFLCHTRENGLAMAAQSQELVPADRLLYALRDVTATVDSLPLIAASIMSKKIASGADYILLDVKYGSGAFMKDFEDAKALAAAMIEIGSALGRKTFALLTSMEEPLGLCVGNALEIQEALELLTFGKGEEKLRRLCLALAGEMLFQTGKAASREQGQGLAEELLLSGAALEKFACLVKAQGGDSRVLKQPQLLPAAPYALEFIAQRSGYITAMDAEAIGFIALELGAGRKTKEDTLDYGAGLVFHAKTNMPVQEGQAIATLYGSHRAQLRQGAAALSRAVEIQSAPIAMAPLIAGYLDSEGFIAAE